MFKYALVILLLIPLPFACDPSTPQYTYEIKSLSAEVGIIVINQSSYLLQTQDLPDTIIAETLGIMVGITELDSKEITFNPGPFSSVTADPLPPIIESKVIDIEVYPSDSLITSEGIFHQATPINDLFNLGLFYSSQVHSISDFLTDFDPWYSYDELLFHSAMTLEEPFTGSFKLVFSMENGDEIITETTVIHLK